MSQAQIEYWAGLIEGVVLWSDGDVSVRAAQMLGRITRLMRDGQPPGHVLVNRLGGRHQRGRLAEEPQAGGRGLSREEVIAELDVKDFWRSG